MNSRRILLCAVLVGSVLGAAAAPKVSHSFVCTDYTSGALCRVHPDGGFDRLADAEAANDVWVLPDGNVLFTTGHGVKEITRNGRVVFTYDSASAVYGCQRLANGNTFVAECNAGRLLEVDATGAIVKQVRLLPEGEDGGSAFMRNARVLAGGGYLVAHYGLGCVREYDGDGKLVREIPARGGPHSVVRLPDGNTLISIGDADRNPRVVEIDPSGTIVWQLTPADLPAKMKLVFAAGLQRLPNGNTVVANWLGHEQFGQGPHVIEVTRQKKVVWTFADHAAFRTVSSVVLLDVPGDCTKGEILH